MLSQSAGTQPKGSFLANSVLATTMAREQHHCDPVLIPHNASAHQFKQELINQQ